MLNNFFLPFRVCISLDGKLSHASRMLLQAYLGGLASLRRPEEACGMQAKGNKNIYIFFNNIFLILYFILVFMFTLSSSIQCIIFLDYRSGALQK